MNGLTFKAWHGGRYRSLDKILAIINEMVANFNWELSITEMVGKVPARVVADTANLIRFASGDIQIIDGEINGFDFDGKLRITLRAVDSSWWDVLSEDSRVLGAISYFYADAEPLKNEKS